MTTGMIGTTTADSAYFQLVETSDRIKKSSAFAEETAAALRDSQINDSSSVKEDQDRRSGYTV